MAWYMSDNRQSSVNRGGHAECLYAYMSTCTLSCSSERLERKLHRPSSTSPNGADPINNCQHDCFMRMLFSPFPLLKSVATEWHANCYLPAL